jgi:FKBP-type peptidyl-prolyl cis-trans isomerase FklB
MQRVRGMVLWAAALVVATACSGSGGEESLQTRGSYALGVDLGNNINMTLSDVDVEALVEGLRDALGGREPRMSRAEVQQVLQEFFAKAQEDNAQRANEEQQANLREGEEFLAENRTKEGVIETASGLQYMVLVEGDGGSPEAGDSVTVHYEGRLLDGKVFDSSYERNEPATFALNRVIAGWSEGVQLMTVGSKYRFFVPAGLAYGAQGRGPDIGPNATLVFDVELLAIVP